MGSDGRLVMRDYGYRLAKHRDNRYAHRVTGYLHGARRGQAHTDIKRGWTMFRRHAEAILAIIAKDSLGSDCVHSGSPCRRLLRNVQGPFSLISNTVRMSFPFEIRPQRGIASVAEVHASPTES